MNTAARLERFAGSKGARRFLTLLGLGIWFETYDIFMVGYLGAVLVQSHFLSKDQMGTFIAAGFLGMFVGTAGFGAISDRVGRRPAFVWMLALFSLFTLAGALAPSAEWLILARFLAGVGIGGEAIVIDTYVTELLPARTRGRGVALTQVVGFTSVPVVAFLSRALLAQPDGWRWVMAIGSIGAAFVWLVRRGLPESPRWLESRGRTAEADQVLRQLEAAAGLEAADSIPEPPFTPPTATFAQLWQPPYLRRSVMLTIFNALQAIGFYGFSNWYPRYMIEKGTSLVDALNYSTIIALTAPFGALIGLLTSDKLERKWTISILSLLVAGVGLLFAQAHTPQTFIACGIALTLLTYWFSSLFHSWQCELYPTRFRTTGVGFTYGISRLSAAASSWLVGALLTSHGVESVFAFMAAAMTIVGLDVALLSPPVNNRLLEDVSA